MAVMTTAITVRTILEGRPRRISWERLWTFSGGAFTAEGWPRKNIHTDLDAARAAGVTRVIASGTQYQGYLVEVLVDTFGEGWLSNGTLNIKLPEVVGVGDVITPKARIVSATPGPAGVDVALDVWCENQHGVKVLVGSATGVLDDRPVR